MVHAMSSATALPLHDTIMFAAARQSRDVPRYSTLKRWPSCAIWQ
jgi:hypothetical protein